MIRLLRFLFFGDYHLHQWAIIEELDRTNKFTGLVTAKTRILQCKHCGKLKQFDID